MGWPGWEPEWIWGLYESRVSAVQQMYETRFCAMRKTYETRVTGT
jgi:hypothetical protein